MVVVGGCGVGGGGGRPREATGGHRGQLARTDFGRQLESSPSTPPGPLKVHLFGE